VSSRATYWTGLLFFFALHEAFSSPCATGGRRGAPAAPGDAPLLQAQRFLHTPTCNVWTDWSWLARLGLHAGGGDLRPTSPGLLHPPWVSSASAHEHCGLPWQLTLTTRNTPSFSWPGLAASAIGVSYPLASPWQTLQENFLRAEHASSHQRDCK